VLIGKRDIFQIEAFVGASAMMLAAVAAIKEVDLIK
jgi:hypothetical protein